MDYDYSSNTTSPQLSNMVNNRNTNVSHIYELIWTPAVVFRVTTIIILMILTIIGNSILITIILCHRKLRKKRVNIFLVNLAIGDLMVCLVTMSTEILFVAFGEWVLGETGCKIIVYGQIVTLASATFLLTAMSVDRYQVIVRPLQSLTGQPSIAKKVIAAWLMAFIFAIPQLFIFVQIDDGVHPDGTVKHMCVSHGYTSPWQRKTYFTFLTAYILVIPTAIMTFCYTNIIRVVFMRTGREQPENPKLRFTSAKRKSNADSRKSSSESTNEIEYSLTKGHRGLPYRWNRRRSAYAENRLNIPRKMVSASKTKVVKMTLSVIIAFICCWSPYFIIGLIRIYSGYQIKLSVMYSVSELLAMLHSALNPVLYGMFSTQSAMKMFKSTSNIWCCIKKRRTSSTSTLRNGCGVEHTLSNYDSGIFATNYNKYTLSGVQRHQVIMNKNICGNHHGERIFCDEYQDKKACCSGCTRLFNKFCFYCSCGKNKAQQFYADSHFLQQACVRGRCSANTDSTAVDSTVGNDPMATTTPNDIQLHEVQEGQLVYHSLPVRTNCSCV